MMTLGTSSNTSSAIGQLQDLMNILKEAESQLETYVIGLKPSNLKAGGTEADISNVLQTLQEGLTQHTARLLSDPSLSKFEDLIFAIKLVETYLQNTKSLSQNLSVLKDLDKSNPQPTYDTAKQKLPSQYKNNNLYEAVKCIRDTLEQTLAGILDELNLTKDEVDITSLVPESQRILKSLNAISIPPSPPDVGAVVKQLVNHLKSARDTFKKFDRKGISLDDGEIVSLKELIRNWEKIIEKLQVITEKEDLSSSTNSRNAIAQSIQIHDLLEENYGFLSDLIRSGDLVSPGIL
jgi:hypothetical protein